VAVLSGCIAGWGCGIDGSSYGLESARPDWLDSERVRVVPFCPEDAGIGTPRGMPDIYDGDGFDVLDGRARVRDEHGADLTDAMLAGANAMLAHARQHVADFALLTDASAACGSQVITLGCRYASPRRVHRGVGVAAALLLRAGIPVVSQRDHLTLARLGSRVDGRAVPDGLVDHHESEWVLEHLPSANIICEVD
jgi:uncharacterized protein YbbK (DUF523 family)